MAQVIGKRVAVDAASHSRERPGRNRTAHSCAARTSGVAGRGSGDSVRGSNKGPESGGSAEQKPISRRFLLQDQRHGEIRGGPKVSALANYRLEGFSVERLMTFLTAFGRDVDITIRPRRSVRASGRIQVAAGR